MGRSLRIDMPAALMLALCMLLSVSCGRGADAAHELNAAALNCLWSDLDSAELYASRVSGSRFAGRQEKAQAMNTMARLAFMRMDYEHAWELYCSILDRRGSSLCMQLTANIGLMRICQRTSDNVSFYEYRNRILKLLRTMHDEEPLLGQEDRDKLYSLERSFRMESALYYHELEQSRQAEQEFAHVAQDAALYDDTDRWLMYLYLQGLGIGLDTDSEFSAGERAHSLLQCVSASARYGNLRMNAMACCALSRLLLDNASRTDIRLLTLDRLEGEKETGGWNADNLPMMLALNSLGTSARYGAGYEMLLACRQVAACQNAVGQYAEALETLDRALGLINSCALEGNVTDSMPQPLELYREDGFIAEEGWMAALPHSVMPEYLASVRELMSVAWSGLDDKEKSDYNRNVYLEIQKNIRLDRRYEARTMLLEQSNRRLSIMTYAMITAVMLLVAVYVLFLRGVKRSNVRFASLMKETVELCRSILQPVPPDRLKQHMDTVVASSLMALVQADKVEIDDRGGLHVTWPGNMNDRESRIVTNAVAPFIEQAFDSVRLLSWQADSLAQASKQHRLYLMHRSDSKRGNMVRKTCCQVVAQCLPYIDRMKMQIEKLNRCEPGSPEYVSGMEYVRELAGCINKYNQVLASWISIRQGLVSLNVSSFALQELFDIVSHGSSSFLMKNVTLEVVSTDAVVKADRVLTLFMINTLADNARKFTPSGGKVTVRADEADTYIEISVSDTGIGMSEADVMRINTEKVIDAGSIGSAGEGHGSGFGIMNCKGIIDKYLKSHDMFSVCRFHAESAPGRGSRFSFRLPKGIRRALCLLLPLLGVPSGVMGQQEDSLLIQAYDHAYNAYMLNTEGRFENAVKEAAHAMDLLNTDYLLHGGQGQLLALYDSLPAAAELQWIDTRFATDYETILWLRNEVAVSALALKDWKLYQYNDRAYLKLFKQYFSEGLIEQDCTDLQHANSNMSVALMMFMILLFGSLLVLFVVYARHWIRHRSDLLQIMRIVGSIRESLHDIDTAHFNVQHILQTLCNRIFPDMDSLFGLEYLELHVDTGSGRTSAGCSDTVHPGAYPSDAVPVLAGNIVLKPKGRFSDNARMELQMIADYLTTALQSLLLRFEAGFNDLNQLASESEQMKLEQEQLHVNSMVLDNCLSTLKHETVWYPNRILQLAGTGDTGQMSELVGYYRDIFGILSQQALAQTGMQLVQRSAIDVDSLMREVSDSIGRKRNAEMHVIGSGLVMTADDILVRYLLESLLERGIEMGCGSPVELKSQIDGQFVRVGVFLPGISPNPDTLFSPLEGSDSMAFVLCSRIIREHDECFGHAGCRINAESRQGGTLIWFTLPSAQKQRNNG